MTKALSLILISFFLPQNIGPQASRIENSKAKPTQSLKLERAGQTWTNENLSIAPLAVSPDKLLVTVGNTLYMLGPDKQILWQYSKSTDIVAQPVMTTDGTICVIALDGISFGLDVNTGKKKWSAPFMNGSANYSQIKAYKDNRYLVLIDMTGYREKLIEPNAKDAGEDILGMCKDGEVLWQKEFPRNSDLEVWGDRILAVTRDQGAIEIKEIPPYR